MDLKVVRVLARKVVVRVFNSSSGQLGSRIISTTTPWKELAADLVAAEGEAGEKMLGLLSCESKRFLGLDASLFENVVVALDELRVRFSEKILVTISGFAPFDLSAFIKTDLTQLGQKKPVHPINFYNNDASRKPEQVSKRIRVFYRQAEAFQCVDTSESQRAIAFAFEDPDSGRRQFLVAESMESFLEHYLSLRPTRRHVYEIIREDRPCKLYFDLEFQICNNPNLNGDKLTDIVIVESAALLLEWYGIVISRNEIVELDSSTEKKFSRHLVFSSNNGAAFKSNVDVGAFVREIYRRAQLELVVLDKDRSPTSFIDLSVYTKNRTFRLFLSSKFSKSAIFESLDRRRFCVVESDSRKSLLRFLERSMASCVTRKGSILELPQGFEKAFSLRRPLETDSGKSHVQQQNDGSSPFTEIEMRIFEVAQSQLGRSRKLAVRSWTTLSPSIIRFYIKGSRFCANIGREHRSNNVFFDADLQNGTISQGCFDKGSCGSFRSKVYPLKL